MLAMKLCRESGKGQSMSVKVTNSNGSSIEATPREIIITKKLRTAISKSEYVGDMAIDSLIEKAKRALRDFERFVTPYDSISSLSIYKGGLFSSPYIQIVRIGDKTAQNASEIDTMPYGLRIDKSKLNELHLLNEYAEKQLRSPAPLFTEADRSVALMGIADEIRKLSELKDMGAISEEEFLSQKQRLLGVSLPP